MHSQEAIKSLSCDARRSSLGLAAIPLGIAAVLSCGPALAQSSAWDKMNESLAQGASGSISDKKKEFQADGLSIGSGALSGSVTPGGQSIKPSAAVSAGTSPSGALGSQYTGSADPALTGSASKGSLVGIGQQAQGASNSAVASRGGYSNDRANQADDAVHFLSQSPVPRVPVDESFRGAARSATGASGFGSSSSKDCQQVTIPTANEGTTETIACLQVLSSYVVDSCAETSTVVKTGEQWHCIEQVLNANPSRGGPKQLYCLKNDQADYRSLGIRIGCDDCTYDNGTHGSINWTFDSQTSINGKDYFKCWYTYPTIGCQMGYYSCTDYDDEGNCYSSGLIISDSFTLATVVPNYSVSTATNPSCNQLQALQK